jgi:hypothetical protein
MPAGFTDNVAWGQVLQPLLPLVTYVADLLTPSEDDWQVGGKSRRHRQREADLVAACMESVFLIAIYIWCSRPDSGLKENESKSRPFQPDEWQKRVIRRVAGSTTKSEALTNLCRAVRPHPRPRGLHNA